MEVQTPMSAITLSCHPKQFIHVFATEDMIRTVRVTMDVASVLELNPAASLCASLASACHVVRWPRPDVKDVVLGGALAWSREHSCLSCLKLSGGMW